MSSLPSAAKRKVPVHPELIRIGFLDFVEDQRRAGHERLFPDWKRGNDGYYSSVLSKWFARLLERLGLTDSRLTFHSFRHGFKDALKAAKVVPETRKQVMGHAAQDVHEEYGGEDLQPEEIAAVNSISYPGLDLGHVSYR